MVLKLVRDLMNMAFKMLNGKSLLSQRLSNPSSDPEISKEGDGAPRYAHLDCGDTDHQARLPECSTYHQDPARTVDQQDAEELTVPLRLDTIKSVSPMFRLHRKASHLVDLAAGE